MTVNINAGPVLPLSHVIGHDASGKGGRTPVKRFGSRGGLASPAVPRTQPFYPRVAPAVAAAGSIRMTALPTAGQTFTVNGTTITFVASGAAGNQVNIGASVGTTFDNLLAFLRNSADTNIKQAAYVYIGGGLNIGDADGTLTVTHLTPGAGGNAFTLATTTAATLSAATLSGGSDSLTLTPTLSAAFNPLSAGKSVRTALGAVNSITASAGGAVTPLGMKDVDLSAVVPWRGASNASGRAAIFMTKVAFVVVGSQCVVVIRGATGNGTRFVVKIDDQYITPEPLLTPYTTSSYYLHLPFGSWGVRRVEIVANGNGSSWPQIIWAEPAGEVLPAPVRGPRVAIFGDSFAAGGTYSNGPVGAWPMHFSDATGWDDIFSFGSTGTGILANNGGSGLKYRDRVNDIPVNTDVVIVQASVNDDGKTGEAVSTELDLLVTAILTRAPAAEIILTHVWKGGVETMGQTQCAQHDAIKALCNTRGLRFLSLTEMPLSDAVVPGSAALSSAASAAATSLSFATPLAIGETYRFPDGTKFYCKTCTGTGPYTVTTGSGIAVAQASGNTATQCGKSLWSGSGNAGSPSGWGSSDLFVHSDVVHPTVAGSKAIGYALAALIQQ